MTKVTLLFALLLSALVGGCATSPDHYDTRKPIYLVPFATSADSPAKVRHIVPDSPAKTVVEVGDTILSVDDKPVTSTLSFYSALSPTAKVIRIRAKDGKDRDVPASAFIKPDSHEMWAWLFKPGETISFKLYNPIYADTQEAALLTPKNSVSLVSASIWPTHPRYLEIYLDLLVNQDCLDCKLENIAVLDLSRNSWLTPVSPDYVAWALYPMAGQEPSLMPIPPPIPVGGTATTTTTGSLTAQTYGNYIAGTYAGTGFTTTSHYYDYAVTNLALAYNLGAMIRQSEIQAHSAARVSFVSRRQFNLRIGDLNPGEHVTGFVHFQVPNGFDGPYLVVGKAGNLSIARFDIPKKQ